MRNTVRLQTDRRSIYHPFCTLTYITNVLIYNKIPNYPAATSCSIMLVLLTRYEIESVWQPLSIILILKDLKESTRDGGRLIRSKYLKKSSGPYLNAAINFVILEYLRLNLEMRGALFKISIMISSHNLDFSLFGESLNSIKKYMK